MKDKAPVDLTGGLGFNFEDYVAARLLLDLLMGRPPLGIARGALVRVHWQARETGWLADDLVCDLAAGTATRAGFSIKLDRQVTAGGFPDAFVEAAWRHALMVDGVPAVGEDAGALVLVVGKLADAVADAWNKLQRQAINTTPGRLVARLSASDEGGQQTSEVERALFASLRCPAQLGGLGKSDDEATARLIRAIYLLPFDFTSTTSQDESRAVLDAQSVLRSGDNAEARAMWQRLLSLAASQRGTGGSLDETGLVAKLAEKFELVDHPDYRADWRTLRDLTKESLEEVRTTIPGLPALRRDEARAQVADALDKQAVCVLAGESGVGKSALAKEVAAVVYRSSVWLAAEQLEAETSVALSARLGLVHSLGDVLASARERTLLIVDGAERLPRASLDRLARLAHDLRARDADVHLLVTTQSESAGRIVTALAQQGLGRAAAVELDRPTEEAIGQIVRDLKGLAWTVLRPEVRPALRNLKVLEWVVHAIAEGEVFDGTAILNVSGLIERLWERWVESGEGDLRRSHVLMQLATLEAESLNREIPRTALGLEAVSVLPNLARTDLLRVRDERVSFTHDLLGDWARLRVLIGEVPSDGTALTRRSAKPRWHNAIRLYGQWLIDRGGEGIARWRELVQQNQGNTEAATITRDLLLESAFLASNAAALLEQVWPLLASEAGFLLEIVLERFLYAATVPDPTLESRLGADIDLAAVEHLFRMPMPTYWGSMLSVLHRHRQEVKELVPDTAARIAQMWLAWTPTKIGPGKRVRWRDEAAELAITIAREAQAKLEEGTYRGKKDTKAVFEALLYAAPDRPEEVATLCLELCYRRPLSPEIEARRQSAILAREEERRASARADPERAERMRYLSVPVLPRGQMRDPARDGPRRRVSEGFAGACRDPAAFSALSHVDPAVAVEVLLAICIEEPREEDPYGGRGLDRDQGLAHWQGGYPAMYFRGPFLRFLRESPEHGLTFVVRLVNHATERWGQAVQRYAAPPGIAADAVPSVTLEHGGTARRYVGDGRVLQWHYDAPLGGGAVPSSLMALEKWLYESIDDGQDVTRALDRLLDEATSLALVGILLEVGKRHPNLLEGQLRPLLGAWELHLLDSEAVSNHSFGIAPELIPWNTEPSRLRALAVEWFGMEHRRRRLWDIATWLLLSRPQMQPAFEQMRMQWSQLLRDGQPDHLRLLIERLNPANYVPYKFPDGSDGVVLQWPEDIAGKHAKESPAIEADLEVMGLPMRARRWLDGEEVVPEAQLPHLWEVSQRIAARPPAVDSEDTVFDSRDALYALTATFVIGCHEWLALDPTRLKWCREQLEQVLVAGPRRRWFSDTPLRFERGFDAFAAEAGVTLLARDPQDLLGRRLAAWGVASWRINVTAATMERAFIERQRLGVDFGRLQALAVFWAALRGPARIAEYLQVDLEQYETRRRELIESFVSQQLATVRISLREANELAEAELPAIEAQIAAETGDANGGPGTGAPWNARTAERPTFDESTVSAAFNWIDLRAARTEEEASSWTIVLQEALSLLLDGLGGQADVRAGDSRREAKIPGDHERWVLGHVARAMPLVDEKICASLWRPILALGSLQHHVVESFLQSWFSSGTQTAPSVDSFVSVWQAMLRFALEEPGWAPRGRRDYDLADIVNAILGLGSVGAFAGLPPYDALPAAMLPWFASAAARWLRLPAVAKRWARLASEPEGRALLLPGLSPLVDAASAYDEDTWRDESLSQGFVRYLRAAWEREHRAIRSDVTLHAAFERFLGVLAAHGGHEAQSLRDQVLKSVPDP